MDSVSRNMRPRLAVIGKYFPSQHGRSAASGGVETAALMGVLALSDMFDITVFCHAFGPQSSEEDWGKFRVIRAGTELVFASQPISMTIFSYISKFRPHIVHFHAPNYWGAMAALLFSKPGSLVVTHHADVEVAGREMIAKLVKPLYHALCRRASIVIVSSEKNFSTSADIPKNVKNFSVVSFGLDPEKYDRGEDIERRAMEIRNEIGGDRIIGFVGRLVRYKGLRVLLNALKLVPDVRCLIVGDGPLRNELRALAEALGVTERVIFRGSVDETEKLASLAAMDAFVLPSTENSEAFGIVQVEAHLLGVPTIVSNLPTGVTDVTRDGRNGLVFVPGNADDLAEKLRFFFEGTSRRSLGETARIMALERYTREVHDRRLREVFGPFSHQNIVSEVSPMLHSMR